MVVHLTPVVVVVAIVRRYHIILLKLDIPFAPYLLVILLGSEKTKILSFRGMMSVLTGCRALVNIARLQG
jgi:hypothetical protein